MSLNFCFILFGLLNADGNDNSLELKIVGVDVKKTGQSCWRDF